MHRNPRVNIRLLLLLTGVWLSGLILKPRTAIAAGGENRHNPGAPKASVLLDKFIPGKKIRLKITRTDNQQLVSIHEKPDAARLYRLYLFDLEGHCVNEVALIQNKTTPVKKMEKGKYLFELFCNDQRVDNGQLHIK